jgi:hypothetical protein
MRTLADSTGVVVWITHYFHPNENDLYIIILACAGVTETNSVLFYFLHSPQTAVPNKKQFVVILMIPGFHPIYTCSLVRL